MTDFPHGALPGSLELAYIGDAVYEVYVRRLLVMSGGHVRDMHKKCVAVVCAHAQSESLKRVEGMLTPTETDIVRRARNAHQSPPKNADRAEYHRATSFEALIGWLYLTGNAARMDEIIYAALENNGDVL